MRLDLETLTKAVTDSRSAFRCNTKLQPAGGIGDKVFPPRYSGAVYAFEKRRVIDLDGKLQTLPCVLNSDRFDSASGQVTPKTLSALALQPAEGKRSDKSSNIAKRLGRSFAQFEPLANERFERYARTT